jgi:hypothetical protein
MLGCSTRGEARGRMAFRIGNNFHIIHMTQDLRQLGLWYYDVFAVRMLVPEGHMPEEKRDASLVLIGDLCIEPLAPSFWVEGWETMPLGRFFTHHGQRFHSLAWYVDEGMGELFETLRAASTAVAPRGSVSPTSTSEVRCSRIRRTR